MSDAAIGRETRQLLKAATATLTGRRRGPDHDPEGRNRTPRRHSYDADDDPRAKPWTRIGDGTVAQGLAYREALLQVARELFQQLWEAHSRRDVRAARARYDALSAELDGYTAGKPAPIGRPALARQELAAAKRVIDAADRRLQRTDLGVLEALLRHVDFATGALFPSIKSIAERAACHRNSVVGAIRRLKHHGLIAWVRRSVKTGNKGEFAPQREQTSNAYFFEHRQAMEPRVWQRYWQIVVAKLRRIGATRPAVPPSDRPAEPSDPALRSVLAAVGALVDSRDNAST